MSRRKSVLFVCIGNACRSQMAEAFARKYGSDVLAVSSAGLAPAYSVPEMTRKVMADKNIGLDGQFPKNIDNFALAEFDLIVNLSGRKLPGDVGVPVEEWSVPDPIGESEPVYVHVRDDIERRVMTLILHARRVGPNGNLPDPQPDAVSRRRKFLR